MGLEECRVEENPILFLWIWDLGRARSDILLLAVLNSLQSTEAET